MPQTPLSAPDEYAQLADLITSIARELRGLMTGVVPLTPQQVKVLRRVEQHPGDTPSEVADAVGIQRSNLSAALRVLEGEGLVERMSATENRREAHLWPTQQAAEELATLHAAWSAALRPLVGERTRELDATVEFLTHLNDSLADGRHRVG
ncbi:hypothetical protein GCM10009785_29330 [Brooklawnia cerclae]|uniref:DNA-binding MarR family transcriptional regulator n=1 Tax=Brooklawnia cerclae TaxID=349934 RepID=A0ABX0SFL7_9ACTN|nr:MarR family winged helix-turn-helix transcriptional regulator [Brooklawnia cerclae]NIH56776.1 DNA-binding MarR family transcriptional regulator [Brooklawnia cerclae]